MNAVHGRKVCRTPGGSTWLRVAEGDMWEDSLIRDQQVDPNSTRVLTALTISVVLNEVVNANWHIDTPWKSNPQTLLASSSLFAVIGDLFSRLIGKELYRQQLLSLISITR